MWQRHPLFIRSMAALESGGVIAYPTEGVWGLGCDPFNDQSLQDILSLKSRPWHKGLILVAGNISQFDFLLHDVSNEDRQKLEATWPGHNTWLVPHQNRVPHWIHGRHDTVALRVSTHPLIQEICSTFGGPIVSTSANPAGLPSARTAIRVRRYFKKYIADGSIHLMPGQIGKAEGASTIRSLATGKILRV